ncbi:MAG: shikimate dehydrogenase [Acidobacteriia bacterium]|nr:shikimate dehydrogenase [Terriglobia bacterium]
MSRSRQGKSLFGPGAARVCAVAAAPTARGMIRQVRAALRQTRTVELRLDWLRGPAQRSSLLRWLRKSRPRACFIATCRRTAGGGRFSGTPAGELAVLAEAVRCGCSFCDVEIETAREVSAGLLRQTIAPARILLSFHDFRRTPASFATFFALGRTLRPAALKIAAQSQSIAESLRVLRLARKSGNVVAVPMGETGLPARLLALREGSALAYASVEESTAPGQVSLGEMLHLYRAHTLTRATRVYGVIGDPIGHSLSPLLHNTGFQARKIDAVYLPFLVKDLGDFLRAVPELGLRGFSVTIPHKQAILRHLDSCDPLAADIGAVNTVTVGSNGALSGCNTDYVGVLRALSARLTLAGSRVLIFGAGGSARAAAFALARAGAVVGVCARREGQARELARAAGGEVIPRRALATEYFDAILNTTPVGMHPRSGISPLASRELNCHIVMDIIYRPGKTKLLQMAAARGCQTVSGADMFLAQGIAQWEIWTGLRAPEAAMGRAVLGVLRAEERSLVSQGRR